MFSRGGLVELVGGRYHGRRGLVIEILEEITRVSLDIG
jgi:hypothetical protein